MRSEMSQSACKWHLERAAVICRYNFVSKKRGRLDGPSRGCLLGPRLYLYMQCSAESRRHFIKLVAARRQIGSWLIDATTRAGAVRSSERSTGESESKTLTREGSGCGPPICLPSACERPLSLQGG